MRVRYLLLALGPSCGSGGDPSPPEEAGAFLFASDRTGTFEIFLSQGDQLTQLTDDAAFHAWWPRVSPTGDRFVYYRSAVATAPPGSGQNDYDHAALWCYELSTGTETELLAEDAGGWLAQGVADWSPDGSELVMAARQEIDGRWHLFLSDPNGGNLQKVTDRDSLFLDPSWSPDGARLVYVAFPEGYTGTDLAMLEVHTSLPDGSDEQRLTFDDVRDNDPYWSGDGEEIAFESAVDPTFVGVGKWALRAVRPDGSGLRTILDDGNINTLPRWSPTDEWLYFQRFVFGGTTGFRIERVRRDGSELEAVTPGGAYDDSDIDLLPQLLLLGPSPTGPRPLLWSLLDADGRPTEWKHGAVLELGARPAGAP